MLRLTEIKVPIICLFGAPGCRKRRICTKLVETFGFTLLTTENLLHNEIASGSNRGRALNAKMLEQHVITANDMLCLFETAIRLKNGDTKGFLLVGYPRLKAHVIVFERVIAPIDLILYLKSSDETLISHIIHRTLKRALEYQEKNSKKSDNSQNQIKDIHSRKKNNNKAEQKKEREKNKQFKDQKNEKYYEKSVKNNKEQEQLEKTKQTLENDAEKLKQSKKSKPTADLGQRKKPKHDKEKLEHSFKKFLSRLNRLTGNTQQNDKTKDEDIQMCKCKIKDLAKKSNTWKKIVTYRENTNAIVEHFKSKTLIVNSEQKSKAIFADVLRCVSYVVQRKERKYYCDDIE